MKKYLFNGKVYCEEDLSEQIDNYGGDLGDLRWEMQDAGIIQEVTLFYCPDDVETYDYFEDFLEQCSEEYCEEVVD